MHCWHIHLLFSVFPSTCLGLGYCYISVHLIFIKFILAYVFIFLCIAAVCQRELKSWLIDWLKTCGCSDGSERPHRWCPLANNVEYVTYIECGQACACPEWPLTLMTTPCPTGDSGSQLNTRFLGPTNVHFPNDISIVSSIFVRLTVLTNTQTHRPRYIVLYILL